VSHDDDDEIHDGIVPHGHADPELSSNTENATAPPPIHDNNHTGISAAATTEVPINSSSSGRSMYIIRPRYYSDWASSSCVLGVVFAATAVLMLS